MRVGGRNVCPLCSWDWIESQNPIPKGYALVKKPTLLNIGVPNRPKF